MTISITRRYRPVLVLIGLMIASRRRWARREDSRLRSKNSAFRTKCVDQQSRDNFDSAESQVREAVRRGLWQFRRDPITVVLFLGICLTGFGSAYYHWNPNDRTLLWDRLPIALSFMAILATIIEERVDKRFGAILLWPLLALAVFSLLVWRWTDDLRLYAWVQFFPFLAMLLLFLTCPPKYTGTNYWIVAAVIYATAKVCEHFDDAIYSIGLIISGHTLKHLVAAAASFVILRHFQVRRRLAYCDP